MSKVLIIGYGEMGHAMQTLLHDKQQLVIHDCREIEGLAPIDLEHEASQSDFVLFCLPTDPHDELLKHIAPKLQPHCVCLSIAKGLNAQGHTASQCFSHHLDLQQQPYDLLYGPMISEEICIDRYGFAEFGCTDVTTYEKVSELFANTGLFIRHNTDITGISWSVILKNVYAISFGAADELNLGDNMRGFLAVTALQELSTIVQQMGGQPQTPYLLAGLGDLVTTATSRDSHHHELGCMLARGETENITGEGVFTLEMVIKHKLFDTTHLPLFQLVKQIVTKPNDVMDTFRQFVNAWHKANG